MPTYSKPIALGVSAPDFRDLPGADGKRYALSDFKNRKALVVIFSCNHCPYVQAYEDRINAIARDYAPRGVAVVAINANDVETHPDDSLDRMTERAREKQFSFAYVRDDSQSVAKAYGAECTPEVFIVDGAGAICYHGGIDDNYRDPDRVTSSYLRDALDDIVADRPIAKAETPGLGCSIKWKA